MKIEYSGKQLDSNATLRVTLCDLLAAGDSTPRGPLDDFRVRNQRAVQTRNYFRAGSASPIYRGNRLCTISFSAFRRLAGVREAEEFVLTHEATLPRTGTLICTAQAGGGVTRLTMTDAELTACECHQIGVCGFVHYEFVGAPISANNAAANS